MIVYKITNSVNLKIYVGQTTKSLEDRWEQHKKNCLRGVDYVLYRAMRKYGVENFKIEQIDTAKDKRQLNKQEANWILKLNSMCYQSGYNMRANDNRIGVSKETKNKISKALKNKRSFNCQKIICLNDGRIFESQTSASKYYKLSQQAISEVVNGKKNKAKNLIFTKTKDWDGKVLSLKEIEKYIKKHEQVKHDKLSKMRKNKTNSHFCKSIVCINSGKTYDSISKAAKDLGLSQSKISEVVNNKRKQHKGFIFERK